MLSKPLRHRLLRSVAAVADELDAFQHFDMRLIEREIGHRDAIAAVINGERYGTFAFS
jgi:hypothetical protein